MAPLTRENQERLLRALDTANLRGEYVIFASAHAVDVADPHDIHGHFGGDDDGAPTFAWFSERGWCVARGASAQVEPASSDRLGVALDEWSRRCADDTTRGLLRAVGGLAFDPEVERQTSDGLWRGYGKGRLWLPELSVWGDGTSARALVMLQVSPDTPVDELFEAANNLSGTLDAWCATAAVAADAATNASVVKHPGVERWGELVATASSLLDGSNDFTKVVLAREVRVEGVNDPRPPTIARALHERFPSCMTFALRPPASTQPATFLGATPECLVRAADGRVYIDALAGSAPLDTPDAQLLESQKDRHEHQLVIDAIIESVEGLVDLDEIPRPCVDTLPNIKHLRTPICGAMRDGVTLVDVVARLHPTPAVCGRPTAQARAFIREFEPLERGWYTGVIGWVSLAGGGEFDVALRCALVDGQDAVLFTGAGIVSASVAADEITETTNKAHALLGTLAGGMA